MFHRAVSLGAVKAAVRAGSSNNTIQRRTYLKLSDWATLDIDNWNGKKPFKQHNLVLGEWSGTQAVETIIDPMNGEEFMHVPLTSEEELKPFILSQAQCGKTGLHNPYKNVPRYTMLGRVSDKLARALREPAINDYFTRMIQRVSPKSYAQAQAEVNVSAAFFDNFSGDNVRFLARGFTVPGDHRGQMSSGHRFPYGPVALITPFNFPLEIPALQLAGALYMGNKPVVKVDSKVSVVTEQFMRLMHSCGLPKEDVDLLHCDGPTMNNFLLAAQPRMTLFTGSGRVAEKLSKELHGRIKIEDAGFDWKILGPDMPPAPEMREYIAWMSDQDAYACSGQKCSAQSILFAHSKWVRAGYFERIAQLAERRQLSDLTIGPVLTWTSEAMLEHVRKLAAIPGAKVLFGGKELAGGKHKIPKRYGAIEPTAVFVPLTELIKEQHYGLCTTEVFGPVQVVTEWQDDQLPMVLNALERMSHHLTAGVVSNDPIFINEVTGHTVNGTYYAGWRARTTGAPQNHWFGPAGDPRGAGIGTPEAIKLVWSCHREVVTDFGPVPTGWTVPKPT